MEINLWSLELQSSMSSTEFVRPGASVIIENTIENEVTIAPEVLPNRRLQYEFDFGFVLESMEPQTANSAVECLEPMPSCSTDEQMPSSFGSALECSEQMPLETELPSFDQVLMEYNTTANNEPMSPNRIFHEYMKDFEL